MPAPHRLLQIRRAHQFQRAGAPQGLQVDAKPVGGLAQRRCPRLARLLRVQVLGEVLLQSIALAVADPGRRRTCRRQPAVCHQVAGNDIGDRTADQQVPGGDVQRRRHAEFAQHGHHMASSALPPVVDRDDEIPGADSSFIQPPQCLFQRQHVPTGSAQPLHALTEQPRVHEQAVAVMRRRPHPDAVVTQDAQPPPRQPAGEAEQPSPARQAQQNLKHEGAHRHDADCPASAARSGCASGPRA